MGFQRCSGGVGLLTVAMARLAFGIGGECGGDPSQGRHVPGESFAFQTSDVNDGVTAFENFSWPGGDVDSLRWWGIDARFIQGVGFSECTDPIAVPTRLYEVSIWGNVPGDPPAPDVGGKPVIVRTGLIPTTTEIGLYDALPLQAYEFDLDLLATGDSMALAPGTYWISIQDIDDNICWHWWLSSPDGDGVAYADAGAGLVELEHDLSYCFNATVGTGPVGACCFVDGTCAQVPTSDCAAMAGTFQGASTNCSVTACPQVTRVVSQQKISATEGGFGGVIDNGDNFGDGVANIGDLNGDGVTDLLVGAPNDGVMAPLHGAVWIVMLNADGTVLDQARIDDASPSGGSIQFGSAVTGLGDVSADGVVDIAVGGAFGIGGGIVWVFFLNDDGSVSDGRQISGFSGDIAGTIEGGDEFGYSLENLGDLDGDGVNDIAVGATGDDDGGSSRGAVWILFLDTDGTVKSEAKISDTSGGFDGVLADADRFGTSIANIGDVNGDGIIDLAVGALLDDDGGTSGASSNVGAVWIVFMNTDGSVESNQKISATAGGFTGSLANNDFFGVDVAPLGDADGDGIPDLAVGAMWDDDGGANAGAVWTLFLDVDGTVRSHRKISSIEGGLTPVGRGDRFGSSVALVGDLDGDGVADLVVGSEYDDDGGTSGDSSSVGALYVLSLAGNASIALDAQPSIPAAGIGESIAASNLDPLATLLSFGPGGNSTEDIVVALTATDEIQIFSNGGGDWENFTAMPPIGVADGPTGLALGLFNDDPFIDIAVAHQGDDSVRILVNDGFATFTQSSFLVLSDPDDLRRTIASGDFDLDGDTDLAIASVGLDLVEIWLNTASEGVTPTFVPGSTVFLGRGAGPWSIEPEDVNGDRCLDLIVANSGDDTVSILINDGAAQFHETEIQLEAGAQPVDTAVGDFNLDGLIDIVSANFGDGTIAVACNSAGGFEVGAQFVGIEPTSVTAANLDGDPAGTLDLAVVATHPLNGPSVLTLQNVGDPAACVGNFQFPMVTGQEGDPLFVIDVFLDDDDVPDLATTNGDVFAVGGSVTGILSVPQTCQGDADGSGEVDVDDLLGVIVLWGSTSNPQADINGDGVVNVDDLVLLVLSWGSCN